MIRSWKLRDKVNVAIMTTFALIALIFTGIQLPFQQHQLQSAMKKITTVLQTLVERDREDIANEIFESRMTGYKVETRLKSLQLRLQQMQKVEGILSISIFDNTGKLMVYEGIQPAFSNLDSSEQEAAKDVMIRQSQWQGHKTLVYIHAILMLGERLGFIRIVYSLKDLEHEQRTAFLIFGVLGSILIIMLVLLNLILSKAIIQPITYLRDAMQHIRTGVLGGQVDAGSLDEIGDLSKTFNEMSADLSDSYHKLSDSHQHIEVQNKELKQAQDALRILNEELEYRVEERTDKLAQANAEIITLNDYLKDALVRSEKMADLGQLIAGVGHEIKTPLGAIRSSTDNISSSLDRTLEQLPVLFQSLSEDLQKDFFALLGRALQKQTNLPTRQRRKLKRTLISILEEQNIGSADDIADTLADMGIYDNTDPFLLLFRSSKSRLIMETAYNITAF